MTAWDSLEDELQLWADAGRQVAMWWRDDDARGVTPALEELIALAERHGLPLSLAVIPDGVAPALAEWLGETGVEIAVLQHGIAHENRATAGAKKQELTAGDDLEILQGRLRAGRAHLSDLFGPMFLPVLVPPWNRIDDAIVAALPQSGYIALSAFGALGGAEAEQGLRRVDCHLDLFQWKPQRRLRGEDDILADLTAQLARRRAKSRPAEAPLGIMTHHLIHDQSCWVLLDRLYSLLTNHPGVRFLSGAGVFARPTKRRNPASAAQGGES